MAAQASALGRAVWRTCLVSESVTPIGPEGGVEISVSNTVPVIALEPWGRQGYHEALSTSKCTVYGLEDSGELCLSCKTSFTEPLVP
jgi:hypothetical protein